MEKEIWKDIPGYEGRYQESKIMSLSLDLEAYSDVDLKKSSVYRYAESNYLDPESWKCSRIWGAYMGLRLCYVKPRMGVNQFGSDNVTYEGINTGK